MYAVIKTGGKQYRVAPEDLITVERLTGETGDIVTIGDVLMLEGGKGVEVGAPTVNGASVAAEIVEQGRGDKIIVFKKKRRQNYRRKKGHRQLLTTLRVTEILTGGAKPSAKPKKAAKPAKVEAEKPAAKKAAPQKAAAKKATPKSADAEAKSAPKKAAAKKAASPKPKLFKSAPKNADDLTQIEGVGPKSAEALNELGVYTYAQIASWTPEQIDWIEERVKVKKLFERDGWLKSVKALAAEAESE